MSDTTVEMAPHAMMASTYIHAHASRALSDNTVKQVSSGPFNTPVQYTAN